MPALVLQEARPAVLVVFLLRFGCGAALGAADRPEVDAGRLVSAGFAWAAAVLFSYLLNGCADVLEDRANGSLRPIARGALALPTARRVAGLLAVCALGAAWLAGPVVALAALGVLLLGAAYSLGPHPLKRRAFGAPLVGVTGGLLTYLAGAASVGGPVDGSGDAALPVLAACMALWMGGVGGLLKDLSDREGDELAGRRSAVTVLGERRVLALASGVAAAVGTAMVAGALLEPVLTGGAVAAVAGAAVVVTRCVRYAADGSREERRRPYRAFMVTQHVLHVLVLATVLATALVPTALPAV
ncbi:UbiA family prenyltransferase [Kitasatospora phosalacinea]|uniref:UbiA family prenyltransferase n=1 Tax=Kitasatospora phosalacinea TaxID=2065 RepID=UPI00364C9A25